MDSNKIMLLILGMGLVSYLPRALPAVIIEKMRFGKQMEKFLKLIPYTAMAALICPGVFHADADHPIIGIAGGGIAGILAWFRCPVMLCVLAAIAADFALYLVL